MELTKQQTRALDVQVNRIITNLNEELHESGPKDEAKIHRALAKAIPAPLSVAISQKTNQEKVMISIPSWSYRTEIPYAVSSTPTPK